MKMTSLRLKGKYDISCDAFCLDPFNSRICYVKEARVQVINFFGLSGKREKKEIFFFHFLVCY